MKRFLLIFLITGYSYADQTLWDVNFNTATFISPDYPGSSEYRFRAIPFPTLIYRGKNFRTDRQGGQGIRGIIKDSEHLEINFSFDGNFPTSDKNNARRGMDALDTVVEFGPAIRYNFTGDRLNQMGIQFAARPAFSIPLTNEIIRYQGVVLNPEIYFFKATETSHGVRQVSFALGPLFVYGNLDNYFYDVKPSEETPDRKSYTARDGYFGLELSSRFSGPLSKKLRYFVSSSLTINNGAVNQQASLYKSDLDFFMVAGFSWTFLSSKERVSIERN